MGRIGKVQKNDKGRLVQMMAREIVLECEKTHTHQKMAEICGTTSTTISRWKERGKADANKIEPLIALIDKEKQNQSDGSNAVVPNKSLESVPMEDLLKEIKRRGFNFTLTIDE
jgi:hypothetical protein